MEGMYYAKRGHPFGGDVPVTGFMYLVFARIPDDSGLCYCAHVTSFDR